MSTTNNTEPEIPAARYLSAEFVSKELGREGARRPAGDRRHRRRTDPGTRRSGREVWASRSASSRSRSRAVVSTRAPAFQCSSTSGPTTRSCSPTPCTWAGGIHGSTNRATTVSSTHSSAPSVGASPGHICNGRTSLSTTRRDFSRATANGSVPSTTTSRARLRLCSRPSSVARGQPEPTSSNSES